MRYGPHHQRKPVNQTGSRSTLKSKRPTLKPNRPRPVCHVCSRSFSKPANLEAHQRVHTKERPYTCHICDEKFPWKSGLNYHNNKWHKVGFSPTSAKKHPSNENSNGNIASTFLMSTTVANERIINSGLAIPSTQVASSYEALPSQLSTSTTPKTPLSLSIPSAPLSPSSQVFIYQSTINCPAAEEAISIRSAISCQANCEDRIEVKSFFPGDGEDMVEPSQLQGVWENGMPVEVDLGQPIEDQEDLLPLLRCPSEALEDISLNTPFVGVCAGLPTLEEPGEPFEFC